MSADLTTRPGLAASLFEDFNLPERPVDVPPPPEPTFTAAELDAVRQEAWNEGYLAATAANADTTRHDGQEVFAALLERADELDKALTEIAEQNAAAVARWLVCSFVTAFPGLSNGSMTGRTQAVANLLGPVLRSQSQVEVRRPDGSAVSFHSMYEVCRQIETQQIEDPSGGAIVIGWRQGEAEINPARTWEDIRSAIMPLATTTTAAGNFELTLKPGESIRHVRQ